jgi:hypothetical protein
VLDLLVDAVHQLLPGRPYAVVHADTQDARGIDVAFLYEATMLTPGEVIFYVVMRRNATRDIVQMVWTTRSTSRARTQRICVPTPVTKT